MAAGPVAASSTTVVSRDFLTRPEVSRCCGRRFAHFRAPGNFITKPEFTRQYWAGLANVSDWKKGSPWQHVTGGEKPEIYITGKVLECIPLKRLVLSWADPDDLADKSRVTFEIEAIEDQVCLTVTHGNFKAGSTMAGKFPGAGRAYFRA